MGDQFEPYLSDFMKKTMSAYQQNAIGSFVYSVEFCFTSYNHKAEYHGLFREAFDFVCRHTFNSVLPTRQDCEYNPDLVNDFFGLSLRYIRKNEELFYKSAELETFVQLLLRCACLESFNAVKTHSTFIVEISKNLKHQVMDARERALVPTGDQAAAHSQEVGYDSQPAIDPVLVER